MGSMIEAKASERLRKISIAKETKLIEALRLMDQQAVKLLLVMDGDVFHSLVSIGDIQRAIVRQMPLDSPVEKVLRKNIRVASEQEPFEAIKQRMLELRAEMMPVVNQRGDLVRVHFWDEVFVEPPAGAGPLQTPVVIMAGGLGARLRPITNVIPKPLIPIGERTIIEEIMDRFHVCGARDFYVSVNYKADMVESYLNGLKNPWRINYFREDRPLGTAGSLHLLRDTLKGTFFVTNCDILVEHDYREILGQHRDEGNEITAVAALKVLSVPYGVFECDTSGRLNSLREKPDVTFLVNVGLYILEPHLLAEIPAGQPMHITQLLEQTRLRGGRVGLFPIRERSWFDIGEWAKYFRAVSHFNPGSLPQNHFEQSDD
ncbi:MAG TPA: nucleotidyltransferase family protein [Verrucomicrobiae bacterium]|jgi:dTDP-glucose pyrophosphorylase